MLIHPHQLVVHQVVPAQNPESSQGLFDLKLPHYPRLALALSQYIRTRFQKPNPVRVNHPQKN